MKTWLKGGIIGGVINLILIGIMFSFRNTSGIPTSGGISNVPQIILILNRSYRIANYLILNRVISVILSILHWFIIGALIGWIVGLIVYKVKSKKQQAPIQTPTQETL